MKSHFLSLYLKIKETKKGKKEDMPERDLS